MTKSQGSNECPELDDALRRIFKPSLHGRGFSRGSLLGSLLASPGHSPVTFSILGPTDRCAGILYNDSWNVDYRLVFLDIHGILLHVQGLDVTCCVSLVFHRYGHVK